MRKGLVLLAVGGTFFLLVLGGLVSGTGSGLGCGSEWPLCRGQLVPPFSEPQIFIEWLHRLLAALVGGLVLATSLLSWRRAPSLTTLAVVILLAQVALGALTVRLELPTEISTAHLAVGTALFAVLVALAVFAFRSGEIKVLGGGTVKLLWLAAGATYLQMVLGAYVRHSGAGLACPDVPLCLGQLIPPLSWPAWVHFLHRLGGLLVLGLVHAAGGRLLRTAHTPALRRAAFAAMILVVVQIGLGVLTVTTRLQAHVTTTHLAVALALLGTLVYSAVRVRFQAPQPSPAQSARRASLEAEEVAP